MKDSSKHAIASPDFDYVRLNGEAGAKNAGVMRVEGKEYLFNDGDVVHFLFNA